MNRRTVYTSPANNVKADANTLKKDQMAPKEGGFLKMRKTRNKERLEYRRKEYTKSKRHPKERGKAPRKASQAQLKGSISTDVKYAEKYTF